MVVCIYNLQRLFSGVQKCNSVLVYDAIAKLSHIVFGRNHPIYQHIIFNNACDRMQMPAELRITMNKYITGSKTMTLGKCQGGDAISEKLNKESKSWLKMAGIPGEEQWLRIFRNIDNLNQVIVFFFKY